MAFGFSAHIVFSESSSDDEPELQFPAVDNEPIVQFLPVDDDVVLVKSPLAVDEIFTPTKPEDVYEFNGSDDGTRAVTLYCLFVYFIFNAIMLVSELEPAPQALRIRDRCTGGGTVGLTDIHGPDRVGKLARPRRGRRRRRRAFTAAQAAHRRRKTRQFNRHPGTSRPPIRIVIVVNNSSLFRSS